MESEFINQKDIKIPHRFHSANIFKYQQISKSNKIELEQIRKNASEAWLKVDDSETTYGHFFDGSRVEKKETVRPTSRDRRNRPHPSLVFLTTRLKNIPGYYNSNETTVPDVTNKLFVQRPNTGVIFYRNENTNECVKQNDQQSFGYLQKPSVLQSKIGLPNVFCKQNGIISSQENLYQDKSTIIQNNTNLELSAKKNAFARKPYRGDFLIHYDWHPRLKAHSLNCLC